MNCGDAGGEAAFSAEKKMSRNQKERNRHKYKRQIFSVLIFGCGKLSCIMSHSRPSFPSCDDHCNTKPRFFQVHLKYLNFLKYI